MKRKIVISLAILIPIIAIVLITYFLIPPGTQEEFLRKNDATLGQYSSTYDFNAETHKIFAVFKSRLFQDPTMDRARDNCIIVYMENSENEDLEVLQAMYEKQAGSIYALDKKNHRIDGEIYVHPYGDYCKNIILVCGTKVEFEDLKYLILLGTQDAQGEPQKLMFPLVDARSNPFPAPRYKPVEEPIEPYKNGPEITLSEYEQIQEGMDYITVVGIVGSEGELMSSVDFAGHFSKMYCWYGEDGISNAVILFSDGSVSSKSEFLLS